MVLSAFFFASVRGVTLPSSVRDLLLAGPNPAPSSNTTIGNILGCGSKSERSDSGNGNGSCWLGKGDHVSGGSGGGSVGMDDLALAPPTLPAPAETETETWETRVKNLEVCWNVKYVYSKWNEWLCMCA
jgi:hypothetical protein